MTPWLDDGDVRLYHGDALDVLSRLPDESVDCVVTSPPYWGLRDYGTGEWEGGDPDCDHKKPGANKVFGNPEFNANRPSREQTDTAGYRERCGKCGATRVDQQLGLEPTPDLFVTAMVEVFREVRRVLAPHGTCWVNLGDSYVSVPGGQRQGADGQMADRSVVRARAQVKDTMAAAGALAQRPPSVAGLKPKDLVGIPWKVAFALQADGWVLRSDVVWSKPNPMPESVTDRPTKAHEYVFMLTKARWVGAIEPTPMAERDAAWLAALIDGEGSICFQERANKEWAPTVSPRVSIVNTNRALLERAAEITGIATNGVAAPRKRGDGTDGRPIWTWQITDKKAARILTAIRPFLIAKRTQADLALAVYALNAKMKGRGRVGRTTDADLAFKRRCAAACSDLNRGRETDLAWFTPPRDGRWIPEPYAFDQEAVREPLRDPLRISDGYDNTWDKQPNSGAGNATVPGGYKRPQAGARNIRSVWTIATQPYPEAHFATFPEELARRCILAGCPVRVCRVCGVASERVVVVDEHAPPSPSEAHHRRYGDRPNATPRNPDRMDGGGMTQGGFGNPSRKTLGWTDCECKPRGMDRWRPGVVLDPFIGSGTVAKVARDHGRHSIGIDLNSAYLELAARRLQQLSLLSEPA